MRIRDLVYVLAIVACVSSQAEEKIGWDAHRVHETFFTEGASIGDIDGDGAIDLVAGPLWYRGPEFTDASEIAPAKSFPIEVYSDQFFSHVVDVNSDGRNDVIVFGFPGKPARLYLNPGSDRLDQHWEMREITGSVDNESPAFVDIVPGGLPEIVCGRDSHYGYYQAGDDPTTTWSWRPVSRPGACAGRFAHGLGVGDIDGDGRMDLIDKSFWWRQPEGEAKSQPWQSNRWAPDSYGQGGAQICVSDVDGDGDADLVTSLNAHGFGLAWFEQRTDGEFVRHDIMGDSSLDNPFGVAFSQLHAVAMADIDGDGLRDIVTGKRWMAHRGKDVGGLQEPVLFWFKCQQGPFGMEFDPHRIDNDSGVGVDVVVGDLNGDSAPDIVSSSKRGLVIHFQGTKESAGDMTSRYEAELWRLTEGRDQSGYAEGFSPVEAAENMLVPNGFHVDLIASEPELTQPVAMCFDARGRIWVIEGHTYPNKAPVGEGQDRVLILEDRDADGSYETRKVFAEGLNLASGIEVGFGGVWIGAAPELLFIPDVDQDDVPDSAPEVKLDGWGYHDTHETLNSFTWGPDGWLYGCQGVFTHSNVGKPGTPEDTKVDSESPILRADQNKRTPFNAGVWRYHPVRDEFEVFAHGTSNPWGVDFNDRGDWFISACVIPHLFHVVQGGRYQRQAGQHFNRYTYDDIKTIADHSHYAGNIREHAYWGENKTTMPAAGMETSMVGGGHAHCGLAIYNGGVFPPQYDGDLLFHNLHGHRLVRERVSDNGSGYIGKHRPDFALARDHHQVGVGVMVGPDGAVYTSDWHDPQTCHNRVPEVWNRTDGRLFRIRYGELAATKVNLWRESDASLVGHLTSDNGFLARQSQRVLQERAATGQLEKNTVAASLKSTLKGSLNQRDRLRALWTLAVIGELSESDLAHLLTDHDEYVRGWALHFIGERRRGPSAETLELIAECCSAEKSFVVRRYAASLLQRLPVATRMPIIQSLLASEMSSHDHNLPLLVWYALEPLVEGAPEEVLDVVAVSGWSEIHRFVARRNAEGPEGRELLVSRLGQSDKKSERLMLLEELLASATRRGGVAMPSAWRATSQRLNKIQDSQVRDLTRSLAVHFGDESVLPHFRGALVDSEKSVSDRIAALNALRIAKDPKLAELLVRMLDDSEVAERAAAALAAYDDAAIADGLLLRVPGLDEGAKTAALNTLVSRPSFLEKFVDALEDGRLDADGIPAFIVRQAVELGDESLNERLERAWGKISINSADKKQLYDRYRAMLRPPAVASANASRGRVLYEANCGKCHKLFGVGGAIGPDITGANRTSVEYWLQNILEPNALIGRAYQMTSLLTTSGQSINGIVVGENDDAITIQTATESLVVPRDEIEIAKLSAASLMPEGQLQPLSDDQVRDLIKYLTGPGQVALPAVADETINED